MSSNAGATTVVDYPAGKRFSTDDDDGTMHPIKPKARATSSSTAPRQPVVSAMNNVDYLDQTRPFFVKIGKGGLLEALEKLDKQLIDVSPRIERVP